MSGLDLGFLDSMDIAVPEKTKRTGGGAPAVPINGVMRIRKSGKVEFTPEFRTKVDEKWLDLFFAHDWVQYDKEKNPNVLFLCINTEEKPAKADIKTEGTIAFIKAQFWAQASEVFGFDPELPYIDLQLEEAEAKVAIALLPKVVQRGETKGAPTYVQRENITLNVLSIGKEFLSDEEPEEADMDTEGLDSEQEVAEGSPLENSEE